MNNLKSRLDRLVATRDKYQCKNKESNAGKRVIPLLGASAVGKSTIISACIDRAPLRGIASIAEAGTTGTRAPRPGDPTGYRMGVPLEEAIELIEQGAPANWSLSPTGEIYMTLPDDFPVEYNFMACLPDSLPMLNRAGFEKVHPAYVVTPVDTWEEQLAGRLFTADSVNLPQNQRVYRPDAIGRAEEAITSLEYAMSTRALIQVCNTPGDDNLARTADRILSYANGDMSIHSVNDGMTNMFEKHVREMYSYALDLSWHITESQ